MTGPLIWYAAYGSNLCRERFLRYLQGGPVPGSTAIQSGARDPSPPRDDRRHELPGTLYFAGRSITWNGGGVAYLDVGDPLPVPALGRVWLISLTQLEDVYRQENREPEVVSIDLDRLLEGGSAQPSQGAYGRLVVLEPIDDIPVITFTAPGRRTDRNPPHQSYRTIIARGLTESWGIDRAAADRYLDALS